jgi:hypothetical protein
MSLVKENIRYIGTSMNLNFNLSSDDNFLGYQQEIDNLTQNTSGDLINPPIDVEERRLKYVENANSLTKLNFYFTLNGTIYENSFLNATFTKNEIDTKAANILNSFFIFDLYNTYNVNNQTKILTTYITKISNTPTYKIDSSNQIYCLYLPVSYINTNIASGKTTITGYTKISFYNAKSGLVTLFYNNAYSGSTTATKMFFPTVLNLSDLTWNLTTPTFPNVIARQLWNSAAYIEKVNNTYSNTTNETPNYPSNYVFDYKTGKYVVST